MKHLPQASRQRICILIHDCILYKTNYESKAPKDPSLQMQRIKQL